MDWDYIFSLSPEDLTEEEKDDLYNTVTWFSFSDAELDAKKSKMLLRISQEVLKYKGEQVEILLHKLDELATQQGEEEMRRMESDIDARSSKSRKSSSLEIENLEQKYLELKSKFKKQVRINEKNVTEIGKLQKKIADLEDEKNKLINEMQLMKQEDTQSDISETVKEQHKELLETLHNKNRQISELLVDIEATEKENIILREKLTNVRDELSVATKELTALTENLKGSKIELDESQETIKRLTAENDILREELTEVQVQRGKFEEEMEEFTLEVNHRVDEWKNILDEKEKEIEELRLRQVQTSQQSSSLNLQQDFEQTQALNRILQDRENQLIEVKTRLQEAVKEMEESTCLIKELTEEKQSKDKKLADLTDSVKELKKQLKAAHERCKDLQDDLAYAEKLAQSRDNDIKEMINRVKDDGEVEFSESLEKIHLLKCENQQQERKIKSLVKASNKLQDLCDQFEKENEVLREKAGIGAEDVISTSEISVKQKQQKRELHLLRKKITSLEEENLQLKLESRKASRALSLPSTDQMVEIEDKFEEISIKNQVNALVEENEALRKGLHEILNSLNARKETSLREIKSETFEQLLRALDVKHISGWYHPAMRLQAELHNLEGINAELREQLRLTKLEVQSSRGSETPRTDDLSLLKEIKDISAINNIQNILENLLLKMDKESDTNNEIEKKLLIYKESFLQIQDQIAMLYKEYLYEKQTFIDKISECEEKMNEFQESNNVKDEKISLLTKECTCDESLVSKSLELTESNVILGRKCTYLKNETTKLTQQIRNLEKDLNEAEKTCMKKINELVKENKTLSTNFEVLTNQTEFNVDRQTHTELQKNFDNLTIKYRNLLTDFTQSTHDKDFELKMFKEIHNNLQKEKGELEKKVSDLCEKLYNTQFSGENVEILSRKLAESEINEINERQRANHTNNLYELVKEQLQKSEDQLKQVEKYNNEILQRNIFLQEQLKDAENKLVAFIDITSYKVLQSKYNELLQNNEKLNIILMETKEELAVLKNSHDFTVKWSNEKEQELLGLKHLIVDLQAASDDKMQIARLSAELSTAREREIDCNNKIEHLNAQLQDYVEQCEELSNKIKVNISESLERETEFRKKISLLRDLLNKSKIQYLGCIPLSSEEKITNNIKRAILDKHEAFLNLYNSSILTNEASVLKEQYEKGIIDLEKILKTSAPERIEELMTGYKEKKLSQFNEIKYRRQSELKETQLRHIFDRVKIQDEQIIKLEEEMFTLQKNYSFEFDLEPSPQSLMTQKPEIIKPTPPTTIKLNKVKEVQTDEIKEESSSESEEIHCSLRAELINVSNELINKEQIIQQLKSKVTELEMSISLFRKQLGDKQSQITFYERHILELQTKKEVVAPVENVDKPDNEEVFTLKLSIKSLQENLKQKDEEILKYQSLLKDDRDKHSMAAALMREELNMLQKCLAEEKQKFLELKSSINEPHPSKAALEQYFQQVHSLEGELSDLHTTVSSLESQLQASRQEAVRWRTLANDRLESMQKLGKELEEIHNNEIMTYKHEAEKWRDEVSGLKQLVSQYRSEMGYDFDFKKIIKEKEDRVHELTVKLRQAKSEARKNVEKSETDLTPKLSELESVKEHLEKEHESLKRRFEQLLIRERNAREEIRELKGKLAKKPSLSARSDRSDRSIKEQLQKKITSLENENADLRENLSRQIALNETHRIKISDDFDRWNKQKHWQQTAEKLKNKLKAKESDFEKLQQTCAGYRILIEKLEREKYNLENRVKTLKSNNIQSNSNELEMLRLENMKLFSMNEALNSKLEMQQHHSGGLGAAMLQEKLEAQERKIAVLEMSAKGSVEVRAELERLQNSISSLQKNNLCLEAENLELKLDLEKSTKELPYLREQIQHLENYIEVLKKENAEIANPDLESNPKSDTKKVQEMERTIFILKRVIEKVQAENKRLLGSKRPYPDRTCSADKLRRDHQRLKEQYCESIQKVANLEKEVAAMKAIHHNPVSDSIVSLSDELSQVKEQLDQKTQLLDKVRVLLQRAAVKEKTLLEEINELKARQQPAERELEL